MNPLLAGSSAAEFGMDSMFQSSRLVTCITLTCMSTLSWPIGRQRQRQTAPDEDAPPMISVNDIVNEVYEPTARRSMVRIWLPYDISISHRGYRRSLPSQHSEGLSFAPKFRNFPRHQNLPALLFPLNPSTWSSSDIPQTKGVLDVFILRIHLIHTIYVLLHTSNI